QRQWIARRIKELQPKATVRAIGKALGVHHSTAHADLVGNPTTKDPRPTETKESGAASVGNPTTQIGGAEAVELIEKERARKEKADNRVERVKADEERVMRLVPAAGKYRTIVLDPAWDYKRLSLAGRAKPGYAMQSHEELLALKVGEL